jgi:hypothetical protein
MSCRSLHILIQHDQRGICILGQQAVPGHVSTTFWNERISVHNSSKPPKSAFRVPHLAHLTHLTHLAQMLSQQHRLTWGCHGVCRRGCPPSVPDAVPVLRSVPR